MKNCLLMSSAFILCFNILLFVVGLCQIPEYYNDYPKVSIKITYYNSTNYPPIFSYTFQDVFECINSINIITFNECNNITQCPNDININKVYDYYCNCNANKCSFTFTNYFYKSYQFLLITINVLLIAFWYILYCLCGCFCS